MNELQSEKSALRASCAQLRETLVDTGAVEEIAENFFLSPFADKQSFFVYCSFRTEVGTEEIIKRLLAEGKTVCLPRVEGDKMVSALYTGELERGAYGLMQPPHGEDKPCEVALTPLLAYDERGQRLGYGGGYYDAYFAARPEILRVGLAYAGQAVRKLPADEKDIPLDAVITERGIIRFTERALLF